MIGIVLIHGLTFLLTGQDAEARDTMKLLATMGGRSDRPHIASILARLALRAGDLDAAVQYFNAGLCAELRAAGSTVAMEKIVAATADHGLARRAIESLDHLIEQFTFEALAQSERHQVLTWYAELGALDKAYAVANHMLDDFAKAGMVGMTWSGLWLDELREFRNDRRFQSLAERLGLIDYWNHFGPPDACATSPVEG